MDYICDANLFCPPKFVHVVDLSNFPHDKICLKIGVPIVLLINITQSLGLAMSHPHGYQAWKMNS